jgi:hypothetical protein
MVMEGKENQGSVNLVVSFKTQPSTTVCGKARQDSFGLEATKQFT